MTQTANPIPRSTTTPQSPQALLAGLGSSHTNSPLHIRKTHIIPASNPDQAPAPLDTLQSLLQSTKQTHPNTHWLLTLAYDLAPTIEPSVLANSPSSVRWASSPSLQPSAIQPAPFPHIVAQHCTPLPNPPTTEPSPWSIDPTKLKLIPKSHYINMVTRALDYIAAGDIYQVNLTHPITLPFTGSSLSLAHHLFNHTNPEMGSFTTFDDNTNPDQTTRHAIISLSPETFLTYTPTTNTLTTVPMKGTAPASSDPNDLYRSEKDRAELNMIIDLMRNDLARISIPGSVKITNPRQITTHHNAVHQATATIESTPRPPKKTNTTLTDILRATFPPGSITGAPKIRAMQIIHQLEQSTRGPYCGSTIHLAPDGSFTSSVNIRILHIQGTPSKSAPDAFESATLTYHTGAGIVADSDPESEWQETLTKASILEAALKITLDPQQ